MNRLLFLMMTCLIFSGLMLMADGEKKAEQVPVVKDVGGFFLAFQDFNGPYDTMQKKIIEFVNEFMKQGMIPMGNAISLYYNSPQEVKEEELKWAFGFVVPKETQVKKPIKLKEFKTHKVVLYLHKGSYEKLHESHQRVGKFIKEKGFKVKWPMYDRYLNNPQMVKPEDLKTQIIVPIE
jgi:AraC family transcriptional regulator